MEEYNEIEWSESTTTLRDIAETVSFPCVVRVCEGYESGDEITSFSLGDLIKIDSCEVVKKVRGRFVEWGKATAECSGRFSKIVGEDVSIPVSYKGCVRVLPKYGVYHVYSAMEDIITDFPRYVEVMDQITGILPNDDVVTITKGDVLETVGWKKPKDKRQLCYLKCKHNSKETLQIPSSTCGRFRVLRDDMEYTLQEVIQRFPLPQIVQFADQISKEQISSDIKEAIENLDNFEGKIMLEKVYSEQILFGHYKSLHADPVANKFLKRTAIMIPLTDPELEEVTVQYPLYMDSQDYEVFVIKNFRDTKVGRQVMDRALYMEFTKKSTMRFKEVDESPGEYPDEPPPQPPPRPPRGAASKVAPVRPFVSTPKTRTVEEVKLPVSSKSSKGSLSRQEVKSSVSSKPSTVSLSRQESFDIFSDQGGSLSDIDWSSGGDFSKLTDDMKIKKASEGQGMKAKLKGFFKKPKPQDRHSLSTTSEPDSKSVYEISDEEENEDNEYDYPDLAKELKTVPQKRNYLTAVMDKVKTISSKAPLKKFSELSVEELEERLRMCSMDNLARICHKESYDGRIFSKLSDAELQTKPFNLIPIDIFKLNEIKEGWTPTFSKDSTG